MEFYETRAWAPVDASSDHGSGAQSNAALLIFELSDRLAAFRLQDVYRITPMAALACPPGLPTTLEGVLDLAGVAVPVLRMDRLFQLSPQRVGLYSMLLILKTPAESRVALLVDRVDEICSIPESALIPIAKDDSFHGCSEATVVIRENMVHILSPARLLLAKERAALADFQQMAQQRLRDWERSLA